MRQNSFLRPAIGMRRCRAFAPYLFFGVGMTRTDQMPKIRARPGRQAKTLEGGEHSPDREKTTAGSLLTHHRPARPHAVIV